MTRIQKWLSPCLLFLLLVLRPIVSANQQRRRQQQQLLLLQHQRHAPTSSATTLAWLLPLPPTRQRKTNHGMFWGHPPHSRPSNYPRRSKDLWVRWFYRGHGGVDDDSSSAAVPFNDTQPSFFNATATTIATATATDFSSINSSGRGNFGDIMSPTSDDADVLFRDGLVTSETVSLAKVYGIHHPLDRMAVTANGNLQRLFSSYYDAPVRVIVDYSRPIVNHNSNHHQWERRVHLTIFDQTFCTADSTVQVHSKEAQALVESGTVGLGQLFRYLDILPEFALQAAGPTPEGGFWRNYTLDCPLVTCSIREVFCPGVWDLQKPQQQSTRDRDR